MKSHISLSTDAPVGAMDQLRLDLSRMGIPRSPIIVNREIGYLLEALLCLMNSGHWPWSLSCLIRLSTRRMKLILDALDFSVVAGSIRHLRPDRVSSEVREAENSTPSLRECIDPNHLM